MQAGNDRIKKQAATSEKVRDSALTVWSRMLGRKASPEEEEELLSSSFVGITRVV